MESIKYIQETGWWKESQAKIGRELAERVQQGWDRAILSFFGHEPKETPFIEGGGTPRKATPLTVASTYESVKY